MALLFSQSKIQSNFIALWAMGSIVFTAVASPYNSFQKNFNAVQVASLKFAIFFVRWAPPNHASGLAQHLAHHLTVVSPYHPITSPSRSTNSTELLGVSRRTLRVRFQTWRVR